MVPLHKQPSPVAQMIGVPEYRIWHALAGAPSETGTACQVQLDWVYFHRVEVATLALAVERMSQTLLCFCCPLHDSGAGLMPS